MSSTFQHFNISTSQHFNISTFQHFNIPTYHLASCLNLCKALERSKLVNIIIQLITYSISPPPFSISLFVPLIPICCRWKKRIWRRKEWRLWRQMGWKRNQLSQTEPNHRPRRNQWRHDTCLNGNRRESTTNHNVSIVLYKEYLQTWRKSVFECSSSIHFEV